MAEVEQQHAEEAVAAPAEEDHNTTQKSEALDFTALNYIPASVSAKIQRKREFEKERRNRIFNAKFRTIGVDKDALDAAVVDNAERAAAEKAIAAEEDAEARNVNFQMKLLEQNRQRMYTNATKDVAAYNNDYCKKEDRREYALSDPRALQKEQPTRLGDVDERLGVSSLQVFAGEDLKKAERKKTQQALQRQWLNEQVVANLEGDLAKKEQTAVFDDNERLVTELRGELEKEEKRMRSAITVEMLDANQEAREAQMANKLVFGFKRKSAEEHQTDYEEMVNQAENPVLNESANQQNRNGTIRRDHFKGSSKEEILAASGVLKEQHAMQATMAQQVAAEEAAGDKQYDDVRKILVGLDMQRNRMYKEQVKEQLAQNEALIAAKHQRTIAELEAKREGAQEAYFQCFGTATR